MSDQVKVSRKFMSIIDDLHDHVIWIDRNGSGGMPRDAWITLANMVYDLKEMMPCERIVNRRKNDSLRGYR